MAFIACDKIGSSNAAIHFSYMCLHAVAVAANSLEIYFHNLKSVWEVLKIWDIFDLSNILYWERKLKSAGFVNQSDPPNSLH